MAFGMFLLHRSLLRPINRLIRLTENISAGNLDSAPFPLAGRNEIGKLATALRTMAQKLAEERATIEQQVRALEEKNRQLLQAQREVIQAEKLASVGRLAAGIAHEIGNPLGIILGYMHMLRSGHLDEGKRADYLGRIEAETERINSIIRDLLDYAQPSSRELQAVSLNAAIEGIYALIAYQKEFNSITPIFHLAEDLPPILANEQLIKQLVLNLTLNARDAMPEGGILTFSTSLDAAGPQPRVCCEVVDTGIGIPPEHQGRIFDPFFTTKEQGKGTGLGLANVHRIVELFGGSISLTSTPGQGTTFMIRFPVMESVREHST
jgi:signal transduction histidine kinase